MVNERIGREILPGFLMRLMRDTRGNALAIIAASIIPLAALAGSAIDVARFYVVKVRLQQACDAGVLAGRKFMDPNNTGTTLDSTATAQANAFFTNNFRTGWFGTSTVSFVPAKTSDNQVSGAATATVPLTVMQMFSFQPVTLNVTCKARYDVADSDVMFVLDTTGSMGCVASDVQGTCDSYVVGNTHQNTDGSWYVTEKNNSRIDALRSAVLTFYDTVNGIADPTTHFRYGFVPYSATVNVGYSLPTGSVVNDTWTYETRMQGLDTLASTSAGPSYSGLTNAQCSTKAGRNPTSGYYSEGTDTSTANNDYYYTVTTPTWTASGRNSTTGNCTTSNAKYIANYTYGASTVDVSGYVAGNTVVTPTIPTMPPNVTQPTSHWAGCIEERSTTPSSSFSATSPPPDLDVDLAASGTSTQWRPLWPEVEYARTGTAPESAPYASRTPNTRYQFGGYPNTGGVLGYEFAGPYNEVPCPKRSSRLATMTRDDIATYVNALVPYGVTYHDVGMTWGTRLLSPNGIFASDTAAWPGRNSPNRYIIFLTDGVMETDPYAYASHGIESLDKRVIGTANISNLTAYHNARFGTACTIAKNHNIKVFVIAYAATATLDSNMTNCASPGAAYAAPDDATLRTVFQTIAQQVAMLRIDQ